ncbi:hypothetical protein PV325_003650, partial [Microctonus aethiopoides]
PELPTCRIRQSVKGRIRKACSLPCDTESETKEPRRQLLESPGESGPTTMSLQYSCMLEMYYYRNTRAIRHGNGNFYLEINHLYFLVGVINNGDINNNEILIKFNV